MTRRNLTTEETQQVHDLIREGVPYRDIADTFGIAVTSVGFHAKKIGHTRTPADAAAAAAKTREHAAAYAGLMQDQEWYADALCAETDPEEFFPDKGGTSRHAKAICNGDGTDARPACPVKEQCLTWALANDERFGIYGGLSERERRKLPKPDLAVLAATGTDAQVPAPVAAADVDEKPAPRHYGLPYVGGANGGGHYPLPSPDRVVHIEPRSKPKTIDWDALRAQHEERRRAEGTLDQASTPTETGQRCRWCRQPAAELVDELCPGCRTDAESRFTAPTTPPVVEDLEATDPEVATTAASLDTPTERITTSGETTPDETTNPANTPDVTDEDPPTLEEELLADLNEGDPTEPAAVPLDVAAYCQQLLRDTTNTQDPLIQVLRANALSALAALDLVMHPIDEEETPLTPVAASAPNPTADRPAAGRQHGTATGTTPQKRQARRTGSHRVDTAAICRAYLVDKKTIREVADTLGHSKSTIRQVLLDEGVTLRDDRKTRSGGRNRIEAYPDELVAAVRTRYLDHQMTQGQVAADLDISVKVVQNVMARHDIPARPSAVASSKAGVGRAQKLDEQAVDQLVTRYQSGESANALAKAFNVSTPSVLSRLRQRGVQIRSRGGNHPRTEA